MPTSHAGGIVEAQGDFGGLLRRRRAAAGLTQEELAHQARLSVRTIRDLERRATARPYRNSVSRLADALSLAGADRDEFARAARTGPGSAGQAPASPGPRQLPATVADFTGRSAELKTLGRLLDSGSGPPGAVVISAIGGTAGVGKTALAVHWAHQAAARFPDGQLYVNLRGYDPDQPMQPADALAGFLRALGVPGRDIPPDADERASRYRSLLAGKRVLVVLDNAGSADQVRPLLPGTPGCTVLVTSRDSLSGLVARDGARRLDLDLLPPADADILLTALIGDRAATDPAATAALATQCCRLPLAVRVAAELAVARPAVPLTDLAAELADQQRRLDLLDAGGDPRTAVRAVFSWSYRHLNPGAARAFRLAGLHPGADLDDYAVAALTGGALEQASDLLDLLVRAHLIQATGPSRYVLHDLLRGYARELAAAQDGADDCRAALTRLFDHYLHTAGTAMDILYPAESHRRPRIPDPATPVPPLADPGAALAWVEAQRAILVAVAAYTAASGWASHATRLGLTLFRYLDLSGHHPEASVIYTCAHRAARDTGDRSAEAIALHSLGTTDLLQCRYQQATARFGQALALFRETGDRTGEAYTLGNLGVVERRQGRYRQATGYYQQALAVCRETSDRIGETYSLLRLSLIDLRQGRYRQAATRSRRALALCRETGHREAEAMALNNLGRVDLRQGRYRQAASHHRQALALCAETGDRTREADALTRLGDINLRQGHFQQATSDYRQALALCAETGDRLGEAETLNGLGDVFLATGQPGDARAQYTAALGLASQIGDTFEQARAQDGLGRAHHAAGVSGHARSHWEQALALYTELGAPEVSQVRAQLAGYAPAELSEQAE